MKKILLYISSALIFSGCSNVSGNTEFENSCDNLQKPFINESLSIIFDKEKNVMIDKNDIRPCTSTILCFKITDSNRWDNININLKGDPKQFPKKDGFFTVSRDYDFKNCIENFGRYSANNYSLNNRNFCIKENKEKILYRIKYKKYLETIYNEKGITIVKNYDTIFVDNKVYIKNESITANYKTGQDFCGLNNSIYRKIQENF